MLRYFAILLAAFVFVSTGTSYGQGAARKKASAAATATSKRVKGAKKKAEDKVKAPDKWKTCCKLLEEKGMAPPSGSACDYMNQCARNGNAEALKVLIEAGCLPSDVCPALCTAIENGHGEVVGVLAKAAGTLDSRQEESSPLVAAIKKNDIDMVKILLEAGANPNAEIFDHQSRFTPLEVAERNNCYDIIDLLNAAAR